MVSLYNVVAYYAMKPGVSRDINQHKPITIILLKVMLHCATCYKVCLACEAKQTFQVQQRAGVLTD